MKSYIYPTATSTSRALIRYIIDMMNREPDRIFYFAFSGGTTPSLMFDIWAHEYREETPWMRMRIFWVDERCVPVNDSDSNYGTMFRLLLSEVGMPDEFVFPICGTCVIRRKRRNAIRIWYAAQCPCAGDFPLSTWCCWEQVMTDTLLPFFPVRNICYHPFSRMRRV